MTKSARQEEMMQFLQDKKCSNVQEISRAVYASPATIRRTLKALEAQGLVRLFHGGVMLAQMDGINVPLSIRENESTEKKKRIAWQAAQMVPPKASVMLDASSTTMYVADYLDPANQNVVFTNCLRTAMKLCERQIQTYCIGGSIIPLSLAATGMLAEAAVNMLQVDYLFFSSQGLDEEGWITDRSDQETLLRRSMLRHAQKSFFLCDSGKFNKHLLFGICNAKDVAGVISDADNLNISGVHWIKATYAVRAQHKDKNSL